MLLSRCRYTGLGTGSTVMAGKYLFAHVAQSPLGRIAAMVLTRTHVFLNALSHPKHLTFTLLNSLVSLSSHFSDEET